jgi:hypothetical protein
MVCVIPCCTRFAESTSWEIAVDQTAGASRDACARDYQQRSRSHSCTLKIQISTSLWSATGAVRLLAIAPDVHRSRERRVIG